MEWGPTITHSKAPPPLPQASSNKNPYISSYKRYIRITSQLDSLSENAFIPKVHKYYLGDPTWELKDFFRLLIALFDGGLLFEIPFWSGVWWLFLGHWTPIRSRCSYIYSKALLALKGLSKFFISLNCSWNEQWGICSTISPKKPWASFEVTSTKHPFIIISLMRADIFGLKAFIECTKKVKRNIRNWKEIC